MPVRSLIPGLLFILSGTVLEAQPDRFERIGELASEGRFKEAAKELDQIAEERAEPGPAELKLLRFAAEAARPAAQGVDGKAAQQVLCMALSYLPEDVLGTREPLRSLGAGRPEVISKVAARRTEPARRAGVQGTVILEVVIDSEGCVRNPRVLKGLPLGLDAAAIAAVRRWFFKPGRLNGRPVAVYYVIPVPFSAKE